MAARATMATLITRIRGLIGDTAGSPRFTDDQIQAVLDRRGRHVVELPLDAVTSRTALGVEQYLVWLADRAPWESSVTLLDENHLPLTASAEDAMTGQWTFAVSQDHVTASGKTYDLYGAAADLLETWISESSLSGEIVEWETDGQRVKRGGTTTTRASLAAQYRAQALPTTAYFDRNDFAVSSSW